MLSIYKIYEGYAAYHKTFPGVNSTYYNKATKAHSVKPKKTSTTSSNSKAMAKLDKNFGYEKDD